MAVSLLRAMGTRLRKVPAKVSWYRLNVKLKSGVSGPEPGSAPTFHGSWFKKMMTSAKEKWDALEQRTKDRILDAVGKGATVAIGSGGSALVAVELSRRVGKLENRVDETVIKQNMQETTIGELKVQIAAAVKDTSDRYQKLQDDVKWLLNEVRNKKATGLKVVGEDNKTSTEAAAVGTAVKGVGDAES